MTTLAPYDEDYVPARVKQILMDELSTSIATFRDLDNPANVRQPRTGGPYVEVEFPGDGLNRDEWGDFGNNAWEAEGTFQAHVFILRTEDMVVARRVMTEVVKLFAGRLVDNVHFRGALTPFVDAAGDGLFRGISRSIEYRYEFSNR